MTKYTGEPKMKCLLCLAALLLTSTVADAQINMKRFNRDDIKPMASDDCARHPRLRKCKDWVHNEPMIGSHPEPMPMISSNDEPQVPPGPSSAPPPPLDLVK
jgi:hypothetical protein